MPNQPGSVFGQAGRAGRQGREEKIDEDDEDATWPAIFCHPGRIWRQKSVNATFENKIA